jgi:crotonobetainyl-CoA:carnitine CoA-transferase CaiB-like acyl-CoA transferase
MQRSTVWSWTCKAKRSVTLDLKSEAGQQIAIDLRGWHPCDELARTGVAEL